MTDAICECCTHGFYREQVELWLVLGSLFLVLWLAVAAGIVVRKMEIPWRRES